MFNLIIRKLEFLLSYFVNETLGEQFRAFIKLLLDFSAEQNVQNGQKMSFWWPF